VGQGDFKKKEKIDQIISEKTCQEQLQICHQDPRTIEEALELDKINGNDLWLKAVMKEMTKPHLVISL